jgi:hypothetical protein
MDSHCVESEESEMGGFCVASKQASSISRALQDVPNCDPTTCDCSQFDSTTLVGIFTCTGDGSTNYSYMYNADGSYIVEACTDYSGVTDSPYDSYCISVSSDLTSIKCGIKIDDVLCNSCEFDDEACPANANGGGTCCRTFDCTNTVAANEGDSCKDETMVPLMTDAPNASPSEMLPPATSSGSCHATKVAIVVSVAAAVWMVSFNT